MITGGDHLLVHRRPSRRRRARAERSGSSGEHEPRERRRLPSKTQEGRRDLHEVRAGRHDNIFLTVFFATLAFAFYEPFFFIGYLISIALFGLAPAIFMAATAHGTTPGSSRSTEQKHPSRGDRRRHGRRSVQGHVVGGAQPDHQVHHVVRVVGRRAGGIAHRAARTGTQPPVGGRVLRCLNGVRLSVLLWHANRKWLTGSAVAEARHAESLLAKADSRADQRGRQPQRAQAGVGGRRSDHVGDRRRHRRRHLRFDRFGCRRADRAKRRDHSRWRRPGARPVVPAPRRVLRVGGAVLLRARGDDPTGRQRLRVFVRDPRRAGGVDHRLGPDPQVRGGKRRRRSRGATTSSRSSATDSHT